MSTTSPLVKLRFSSYRDNDLKTTFEDVYRACEGLTPRQIVEHVLTKAELFPYLSNVGNSPAARGKKKVKKGPATRNDYQPLIEALLAIDRK
jgi:hypothetical protein